MWLQNQIDTAYSRKSTRTHLQIKEGEPLKDGWVVSEVLGNGRMSRVWEATRGQQIAAIKIFRRGSSEMESYVNEMRILGALASNGNCVNIVMPLDTFVVVSIVDSYKPRIHPCIVFERLEWNLFDAIYEGSVDEELAHKFTRDLFAGLSFLHAAGIIHTDISTGNLLLRDNPPSLMIADFGSSLLLTDQIESHRIGTQAYWSPEIILKKDYGTPTDIWSAFAVVYEMFTAAVLFDLEDEFDVKYGFPEETSNTTDTTDDLAKLTDDVSKMDLDEGSSQSNHSNTATTSDESSSGGDDPDYSQKHLRMILKLIGPPSSAEFVGGCEHFTITDTADTADTTTVTFTGEAVGARTTFADLLKNNFKFSANSAHSLGEFLEFGLRFSPVDRPAACDVVKRLGDSKK